MKAHLKAVAALVLSGVASYIAVVANTPGNDQKWAAVVVAVLTALGVWAVPNRPATTGTARSARRQPDNI